MGTVVISLEPVGRADLEVERQGRGNEIVTLGAAFGNPVLPIRDVVQVRVYRPTGGFIENPAIELYCVGIFTLPRYEVVMGPVTTTPTLAPTPRSVRYFAKPLNNSLGTLGT